MPLVMFQVFWGPNINLHCLEPLSSRSHLWDCHHSLRGISLLRSLFLMSREVDPCLLCYMRPIFLMLCTVNLNGRRCSFGIHHCPGVALNGANFLSQGAGLSSSLERAESLPRGACHIYSQEIWFPSLRHLVHLCPWVFCFHSLGAYFFPSRSRFLPQASFVL